MGLGFVLFFWLIIGLILALVVALPLGIRVWKKDGFAEAKKWMLFPFLCLVLFGAIFLVQMLGNALLLGQDPGIGDGWSVRLPGGDELLLIDITEYGWLRDETGSQRLKGGEDILTLQAAGGVYLGGSMQRVTFQLTHEVVSISSSGAKKNYGSPPPIGESSSSSSRSTRSTPKIETV